MVAQKPFHLHIYPPDFSDLCAKPQRLEIFRVARTPGDDPGISRAVAPRTLAPAATRQAPESMAINPLGGGGDMA
jgi:hypothetical protein